MRTDVQNFCHGTVNFTNRTAFDKLDKNFPKENDNGAAVEKNRKKNSAEEKG